ncbi:MAG TPA: tetratricopeptide repeat protein [Candidatus Binatia bacterium]|nr:tetratricopeptide repeat protein [Candidatus Binatia bacterium]
MGRRLREDVGAVALALAVTAVLLRFFSPSWIAFRAWARVPELFSNGILVRRAVFVVRQIADPFVAIDDPLHRVVRWRVLVPLVGHYLHLPPMVVLALAHVGCVAVLAVIVRLGRAHGFTWSECALLAIVVGTASWFFVSTGWLGYYDSLLALGLVTVALVRRRWLVWLACLLTPWIDERFVLGFPLALVVRVLWDRPGSLRRWSIGEAVIPVALVAANVALRLSVAGSSGSPTLAQYWAGVDAHVPLWRFVFGAWEGLRVGWLVIAVAIGILVRQRPGDGIVLALGTIATLLAALVTANDLSRAATTVVPAVPLGWAVARTQTWWRRFYVGPLLAAATILLPAHHVVTTFTVPINDLWYETHLLLDPPPPFAPGPYLQEAQRAASQGDGNRAESLANVALRLAPEAAAYNVHGVILARQGRWQDALADFDRAITLDPSLAEAWMNRARSHAALGNAEAARSDARRVQAVAPDSPLAADAEALLRSLDG